VVAFLMFAALLGTIGSMLGGQMADRLVTVPIIAAQVEPAGPPIKRAYDLAHMTGAEFKLGYGDMTDEEFLFHTGASLLPDELRYFIGALPPNEYAKRANVAAQYASSQAKREVDSFPLLAVLGAVLGGVIAWPTSGIPVYYRRWQPRRPVIG
jgi:hypothetical protein